MSVHPPAAAAFQVADWWVILDEEDFWDPLNRIQTSNGKSFLKIHRLRLRKRSNFLECVSKLHSHYKNSFLSLSFSFDGRKSYS
jgi:hypothetical protein